MSYAIRVRRTGSEIAWLLWTVVVTLLVTAAVVTVGCSDEGEEPENRQSKSVEMKSAEEAALNHAIKGTTLSKEDFRVECEVKKGYWLVEVIQLPEVPDGTVLYEVTDDGKVTEHYRNEFLEAYNKNKEAILRKGGTNEQREVNP